MGNILDNGEPFGLIAIVDEINNVMQIFGEGSYGC
jgi:hypothetical protein